VRSNAERKIAHARRAADRIEAAGLVHEAEVVRSLCRSNAALAANLSVAGRKRLALEQENRELRGE
jgi:hypothetical protein